MTGRIPAAGQVWKCGSRHVLIEQVRRTGEGGLRYALARPCGPRGRVRPHPYLGDLPVTIGLLPGAEMPPGYERKQA